MKPFGVTAHDPRIKRDIIHQSDPYRALMVFIIQYQMKIPDFLPDYLDWNAFDLRMLDDGDDLARSTHIVEDLETKQIHYFHVNV